MKATTPKTIPLRPELPTYRPEITSLLDSLQDGFCALDRFWKFIYINKEGERRFGRKKEEILGKSLWELYPEVLGTNFEKNLLEAMENGEAKIFEEYFPSLGTYREFRVFPSSEGLILYSRDITASIKTKQELEQSLLRFKIAAESSSDLIYQWDISSGEMQWYGSIDRQLGYDENEIARSLQGWKSILHPQDRDRVFERIEKHLRNGLPFDEEYRVVHKDGSIRLWQDRGRALFTAQGEAYRWIGASSDVTEKKRVQEITRYNERRLRLIIDALPTLISYIDPQYRYRFNNATYEKWFGVKPEETQGRNVEDIVGSEAFAAFKPYIDRALAGESFSFEVEAPYPTGGRYVHASYIPDFDQDGKVQGIYCVGMDLSERKNAEERLKEEKRTTELIHQIGLSLTGELHLETLVQSITDAATELSGAEFGGFFRSLKGIDKSEIFKISTLSRISRDRFLAFSQSRLTELFSSTLRGEGPIRSSDISKSSDSLPFKSYLAVPVISRTGEILGGLFFGHSKPDAFKERAEQIVTGIASQAAIAIDNAELYRALQASEEQYRFLAEAVPQIVFTALPDGQVDYLNQGWYSLTGLSSKESLGNEWKYAVHPDDRTSVWKKWNECLSTGTPYDNECRLRRASDGTYRWHLIRAVPFRAHHGKIVKWFGTATDIDDQKKMQHALAVSEERFKLAEQGSQAGIWDWDLQKNSVHLSPQWKKLIGFEDHELGNDVEEWARRLHPADRDRCMKTMRDYINGKIDRYENQHRLRHKDGAYRWILSRGFLFRDSRGEPVRMSGTHVDITEQKLTEERLRTRADAERIVITISNRLLHLSAKDVDLGISEALKDIGEGLNVDRAYVFLISADGRFMTNSHQWSRTGLEGDLSTLKGLPVAQFPYTIKLFRDGKSLPVSRVEDLPSEAQAEKQLMLSTGAKSTMVVPMMFRQGLVGFIGFDTVTHHRHWTEEMANLLKIVGEIFVNAIQRSNAERALVEQTEVLARSNADLEQFAYISSHDLQEPLRTMSIYLELLERRYKDKLDAEAKEFIETAVSSAQQMRDLIHDILAYSRSSRTELVKERVDTNDILDIAIFNLKKAVEESDSLIERGSLPIIYADRFQMVQLFQNLLSNAIKYRREEKPTIRISCTESETHWTFMIKDNGIGIESRYFERIFQIFERLHLKEKFSGTGIGLALAKKVVERHDGRIWVESCLGKGSAFYFTLPKVISNSR